MWVPCRATVTDGCWRLTAPTSGVATARPDFIYETAHGPVAVFLDGPAHDGERQSAKDSQAEERLQDLGWLTVRIRYDDDWGARLRQYESVFGAGR